MHFILDSSTCLLWLSFIFCYLFFMYWESIAFCILFPGGKWGLLGLGNTQYCVNQVSVQNCSVGGMDFRDGAVASISTTSIRNCKTGIQMEAGAKVNKSLHFRYNSTKYYQRIQVPNFMNIHAIIYSTRRKQCKGNKL